MNPKEILDRCSETCADALARLVSLFDAMETAYGEVADASGFRCTGCEENCCKTRFHHHTLLELIFLCRGFADLSDTDRAGAVQRATAAVAATAAAEAEGRSVRIWCPLNLDDRCLLYASRPMICRLHGIPHELHHPGRGVIQGPGCDAFHQTCSGPVRIRLDRTPFYRRMAGLEAELKAAAGFHGKIRLTVAEMILLF
jgi:Fe-S-cluster containining protein